MDYKKVFKSQSLRLKLVNCLKIIPNKPYLKIVYKIKTGKKLHLNKPINFTEKMNWLKLNDIHWEYSALVDKITVRDYIREKIGEDICFPMLGLWGKYEDIDFDSLPEQFVLKCNHDSGSVRVITDKSKINHEELRKFYKFRLKYNTYVLGRDYPYKNIKPKIIAEQYMAPEGESDIKDYKFFCFDGEPKVMFIITGRSGDTRQDFFDMDFNHLDIVNVYRPSEIPPEKPVMFEEMKMLAAKLAIGMRFVRVDLYEVNGKLYFGEYTFFSGGGFWLFGSDEWERKLGDMIKLPEIESKE